MNDDRVSSDIRPHVLVVKIDTDGYLSVGVECPHDDPERPCATWMGHDKDDPCLCGCEACARDEHYDCSSDYVAEVGRKHCQSSPTNECWYDHALAEVGTEMLRLPKGGLTFRVPAHMTGNGWDDPIDVEPLP